MHTYVRVVTALSRACGAIAAALILMSVGVICHMIFVRGVLGESSIWQTEWVTFALIAATFIGSPYVLLTRGHVNVDLLPLYLHHRARLVLAMVASCAALVFCLLFVWYGFEWWYEAYEGGWVTSSIWRARLWIPYLALPVGMLLLSLQYTADIFALATGRAMPFGLDPDERL